MIDDANVSAMKRVSGEVTAAAVLPTPPLPAPGSCSLRLKRFRLEPRLVTILIID